MVNIFWLGLEGDDVRFIEPHAITDKPLLSFELNEGWEIVSADYYKVRYSAVYPQCKWCDDNHFKNANELILIDSNERLPYPYRASTVLQWMLYCVANCTDMPPFVKNWSTPYAPMRVQKCGCGGFRSPFSGPERCGL